MNHTESSGTARIQAACTSFLALFSIIGIALYGLPFFYDFMVRDLGWTRAQVTSGNALSKLVIGPLFGFVAGYAVDRFGPRRMMMAGIVMAGGALIGLGTVSALWMFYLFYLFNALGYVCGGPLPNQVLLSRWFDKGRGKAMGFAYLGIGVGGALVPLLANWLVGIFGWRGALAALGCLMVLVAFPMVWWLKESPAGGTVGNAREPLAPIKPVLRNPAFYLLAFGSMCSIGAVGGTNQNLKLYLSLDLGFGQGEVARILSLVLVCSLVGRLLMGWLADHASKKRVMVLIYLLIASAVPLLFYAGSGLALTAFAVLFGLGLGGEYLIIPLMAAELFGVKVLGRLLGIIITADGVAEAVTPMAVAYLRDKTGSYATGFGVLIGLALVGAFAIMLLPGASVRNAGQSTPPD